MKTLQMKDAILATTNLSLEIEDRDYHFSQNISCSVLGKNRPYFRARFDCGSSGAIHQSSQNYLFWSQSVAALILNHSAISYIAEMLNSLYSELEVRARQNKIDFNHNLAYSYLSKAVFGVANYADVYQECIESMKDINHEKFSEEDTFDSHLYWFEPLDFVSMDDKDQNMTYSSMALLELFSKYDMISAFIGSESAFLPSLYNLVKDVDKNCFADQVFNIRITELTDHIEELVKTVSSFQDKSDELSN